MCPNPGLLTADRRPVLQDVVVEDLERRPIGTVTGQKQVLAAQLRARDPRATLQVCTLEVPHRWNRCAAIQVLVETRQRLPVFSNQLVCPYRTPAIMTESPLRALVDKVETLNPAALHERSAATRPACPADGSPLERGVAA